MVLMIHIIGEICFYLSLLLPLPVFGAIAYSLRRRPIWLAVLIGFVLSASLFLALFAISFSILFGSGTGLGWGVETIKAMMPLMLVGLLPSGILVVIGCVLLKLSKNVSGIKIML